MKLIIEDLVNITLLLFCMSFIACDTSSWEGTLSLRGSEPHTQLVLSTSSGESYELTGSMTAELARHQYRKVIIRGKLVSKAAGPGFPARIAVDKIVDIQNR